MARIGILVVAYNAESTLRSVLQRIPPEIMNKVEEIFVFELLGRRRELHRRLALFREAFIQRDEARVVAARAAHVHFMAAEVLDRGELRRARTGTPAPAAARS